MKRNKNFQIEKRWIYREEKKSPFSVPGVADEIVGLLAERGLTSEESVQAFLHPEYEKLSDPFCLRGMAEAVETVVAAVEKQEKIVVYGDYDVDGVSATAILVRFFKEINHPVEAYIPSRVGEGYGLNKEAVKKLAKRGTALIITVDSGSNAKEEIELCHELGLKVVVTDHHEITEAAKPDALVNPRQDDDDKTKNLAGAGVAFYLVRALQEHFHDIFPRGQEKWLLDLAALGTICDIVSLTEDNRIIAKFGLTVMAKSRNLGIRALAGVAAFDLSAIDAYKVGFQLGPRLNAAGRLEHANLSLKLMLTQDQTEADRIAHELDELNTKRQEITEKIIEEAKGIIGGLDGKRKIYLLASENWPAGVVGIAASRLVEEYGRPVLIMEDDGTNLKGSARSIKSFNIIQALNECEECFTHYGGHAQAAGFTLPKERFIILDEKLLKITDDRIAEENLIPEIIIDKVLEPEAIDVDLTKQLALLEPFGAENFKPVFGMREVTVSRIQMVGNPKIHLKIGFKKDRQELSAIAFNFGESCDYKVGDLVDAAFTVELNEWQGQKRVDLHVIDIKMSKKVEQNVDRKLTRQN